MQRNTKILLGLGAVALGYYLYTKNKAKSVAQTSSGEPQEPSTPQPSPNTNPCKNPNEVPCDNGSGKCYRIDVRYSKDPCKIDTPNPRKFKCPQGTKRFALNDDIINGIKPTLKGGGSTMQAIPNIIFRKGDLVCGNVITKFIFNKNVRGITTKPSVEGAYTETGIEFIPIQSLTPLDIS